MKQRLIYQDDKSNKFWEVEVKGKEMVVRYGKIGTEGQVTAKKFASTSGAETAAEKAMAEKIKKGYRAEGETQKTSETVNIVNYVSLCFIEKNTAKQCSSFGSEDAEVFPKADTEIDLFFDEENNIIAARFATEKNFLWGNEVEKKTSKVKAKLVQLFGNKISNYEPSAYFSGAEFEWDGDARDLPEDLQEDFSKAIKKKNCMVVWKQIRSVDWVGGSSSELQKHIDQGDVNDYSDVVAVFLP